MILKTELTSIPETDVYELLGYQKNLHTITPELGKTISTCMEKIVDYSEPRILVSREIPLEEKDGCLIADLMELSGNDIREHLKDCHSVIFLAATLGIFVDGLIRKMEVIDMAKAAILDAAASAAIEAAVEEVEKKMRDYLGERGIYTTVRFSPGYGDLPISMQRDLLSYLDAPREIGLSATEGNMMTPGKSITAIIGISDRPVRGKLAGCDTCVLSGNCSYRKRGMTCGADGTI